MQEETLNTWEEFEKKLCEPETLHCRLKKLNKENQSVGPIEISELLYRGQADSKWKLETTLERLRPDMSLHDYYNLILAAKPKVETFTEKDWQIPDLNHYDKWLNEFLKEKMGLPFNLEAYNYFGYLRHHGFPSPLLDWTASPYIAAFFAMNKAKSDSMVSIYVYIEVASDAKKRRASEPAIHSLGPYAKVHRRHFLQQSQYTICTVNRGETSYYARHEEVVEMNKSAQGLLWKFNIPASERPKVLHKLNKMNINAFSLFGTEDSLMDTIATAEILLKNYDL
jgi:FRG domain